MNSDRIQQIQKGTAYPESRSVALALSQVWNEVAQENAKMIEELIVYAEGHLKVCPHDFAVESILEKLKDIRQYDET